MTARARHSASGPIALAASLLLLQGCAALDAAANEAWGGSSIGRIERGPTTPAAASSYQRLYGPRAAGRDHHTTRR